jgi:predicted Kef-type K+ transport protein
MHHEAPLIATIAVSLTFAFAGGFLMLRLVSCRHA